MNLRDKFRSLKKVEHRIHYSEQTVQDMLPMKIQDMINLRNTQRPIVVVCIGTDRSTGDALGPLIGTKLLEKGIAGYHVFGTLDEPVHAVNLKTTLESIKTTFADPYIIGVDACLGRYHNIGMITIADGPVLPGAGVKKDLPPVGDIHITGIVNVSGYMEYFVLQNTRLSLVMNMANIVAEGLHAALQGRLPLNQQQTINVRFH